MTTGGKPRVILVTGLSGAGKSSALAALADQGLDTVDSPPLKLLQNIIEQFGGRGKGLAIGVDARSIGFSTEEIQRQVDTLRARADLDVLLVYLDCDEGVLLRRFTETRRRHPLAQDGGAQDGLEREYAILGDLRGRADIVIDTTSLSPTDFRRELRDRLQEQGTGMAVSVSSFGFKHGTPRDADIVFDVRFLANPHWAPELRPKTGLSPEVAEYVFCDPGFDDFFSRFSDLILSLLPQYEREGKSYLGVAVGCSGGKHRSVAVIERLAGVLREAGWRPSVVHRDLPDAETGGAAG